VNQHKKGGSWEGEWGVFTLEEELLWSNGLQQRNNAYEERSLHEFVHGITLMTCFRHIHCHVTVKEINIILGTTEELLKYNNRIDFYAD
jgi:hypothetical protein